MPGTNVHPTDADLQAFTLGALDDDSCISVEAHLADCPSCQAHAAGAPADTLVELLRSAHARPAASADAPAPVFSGETILWAPAGRAATAPVELAGHARYRLLRQLSAGGMGAVWLAEHSVMKRQVALKVIRPEHLARAGAAERFRREVHAAACLHHPNIVTAYDADQAGETHFLVMEYVEGVSLAEHLERTGPLPVAEACRLARHAALGLQHAHEHGLIHRDIKPHNVMLTPDGVVKILDFGLAALAEESEEVSRLTGANMVFGTPDYIAPEQAEDAHAADIRSDVYSLGCTLYHMLAGRPPFPGRSTLRKLDAHRTRPPESIRSLRLDVPSELGTVLARMMAKDPGRRYQTPAEVATALEPFTGIAAAPVRRRRWPLVLTAALVLAGLGATAVAVYVVETDKGRLVITAESDDVDVVVKQNGKEVRVVDTKTDKSITLWSGVYDLELKGGPDGLKLNIDKATLTRGETVLARIERVPLSGKVGYLGHLPWKDRDVRIPGVSDDGKYVLGMANGRPNSLRIWEAVTKKEVLTLDDVIGWSVAVFMPDSKHVLARHADGTFRLWDIETKQSRELPQLGEIAQRLLQPIAISPDGALLCVAAAPPAKASFTVVELATGKEVLQTTQLGPDWVLSSYPLFSADGARFYTVDTRGDPEQGKTTFRVWDLKGGKPAHSVTAPFVVAGRIALRDGERQIASESWVEKKLAFEFWDIETGKSTRRTIMPVGQDQWDGGLTSPDGRWYSVSDTTSQTVRVFNLETGKEVLAREGILVGGGGFGFSRDGRYFACSGKGGVHLFRLPEPPAARDKR